MPTYGCITVSHDCNSTCGYGAVGPILFNSNHMINMDMTGIISYLKGSQGQMQMRIALGTDRTFADRDK